MEIDIPSDTVIVILTPHSVRESILNFFMSKNFSVICEKPLFWTKNQMKKFNALHEKWPNVMYHRSFNKLIPTIKKFVTHNYHDIEEIEIVYCEDITLHTSGDEYQTTIDSDGGGCINDNFPNCMNLLMTVVGSEVELININSKHIKDITTQSEIELKVNGLKCVVKLDWHSKNDEKSVLIKTKNSNIYYHLQHDYNPFKSSLYHEYRNIFTTLDLDDQESKKNTIVITEMLDLINSHS